MKKIVKASLLVLLFSSSSFASDESPTMDKVYELLTDNMELDTINLSFPYHIPELEKTVFLEQNQACFLKGNQTEKTTLALDQLSPCLGIGALNTENKNIASAHIDAFSNLKSLKKFFNNVLSDSSPDKLIVKLFTNKTHSFREKGYCDITKINTGQDSQEEWVNYVEKHIKIFYKIKNIESIISKSKDINISNQWDDCVRNMGINQKFGFFTFSIKRESFYKDRVTCLRYKKDMTKTELEELYSITENNRIYILKDFTDINEFFNNKSYLSEIHKKDILVKQTKVQLNPLSDGKVMYDIEYIDPS